MALVLADRVQETTTTTGTGTVTLSGAVSGFQSFSAVGNGNTTYYTIADQTGTNWEVGLGTYTASGTTLSRDSVLSSSNSGSLVNFGAGTKNVFVTYPASKAVYNGGALGTPLSGTVTNLTGTASININGTVGATTANTGAFTTLSATGNVTLSGGTANGVLYLNGSKVATSGSALTFDGTNIDLATVGAKVNFATTSSATRNYVGGAADGFSLEMVTQRGASQPLSYKQDYSVGHAWSIAGSGAMTLTSTGLGIGTSSPSSILDVQKAGTAAATTDLLELTNSGNAASMTNTGTGILFNQFYYDATTPAVADAGRIAVKTEGNWTSTASTQDAYMTFEIALDGTVTERARITSGGNLLVGATAAGYGMRMRVDGGIASTGSVQFNIEGAAATDFEWVLRLGSGMRFYVNNASVLATLTSSGVWTNASDARYKENIRPVTYGLAEVMQLQPRAYNIIGSEKQEIGFVAQEVEPFIPELVESSRNSVTEEERLTLSYGQMSAVLVKAIQELKADLDATKAELAALKGTQP